MALQAQQVFDWLQQTSAVPPAKLEVAGALLSSTPNLNAYLSKLHANKLLTAFQARRIAAGAMQELKVGGYIIEDLVGEGGMGRVYRARHILMGRIVALKVVKKERLKTAQALLRFYQEVHVAAQLSHPNVVLAYDAEQSEENLYLAMEFVEGSDLTKLVRKFGPMSIHQACDALRQAALGLQHAHEQGLVHRDIKPNNLLYTPRGQVKLADMGLAMLTQKPEVGETGDNRLTQAGYVIGTPDFLAPEQAKNPMTVDIRADIYSLGCTLFFLLTGRAPYEGNSATEKLIQHVTEPPPNLLTHRPDAPVELAKLFAWCLAKDPAARPQTPAELAAALLPYTTPEAVPIAEPVAGEVASEFSDFTSSASVKQATSRTTSRALARKPGMPVYVWVLMALVGLAVIAGALAVLAVLFLNMNSTLSKDTSPLVEQFTNAANLDLVLIQPGTFEMGSADTEIGRTALEGPRHTVTLSQPFYMSRYEITREQYLQVTGISAGTPPSRISDKILNRLPAANITWEEANAFCAKLNKKDANRRVGWEYRLPTEAEWEYCARCGSDQPFGTLGELTQYTDGIFQLSETDVYGNAHPDASLQRYPFDDKPAGVKPSSKDPDYDYRRTANAWGLYDLHGNVAEWCWDVYDVYTDAAQTDPRGPSIGTSRVVRGGAYNQSAKSCRVAARAEQPQTAKAPTIGFRVVFAPIP